MAVTAAVGWTWPNGTGVVARMHAEGENQLG